MTDRDIIKAELQNLRNILEDKADMCIGSGKLKLLSFANACSGALELLKEQEPQGWISVKDRLPSNENDVIVAMQMGDEGYWVITAYIGDGGWDSDDSLWEDGYGQFITHWMPMPELPKEKDGE